MEKNINVKAFLKNAAGKFFITIGVISAFFIFFVFSAMTIVCYGPSKAARDLFVTTVMETSAAKFLARIYFTDEEINSIILKNSAKTTAEITDEKLIDIPKNTETSEEKRILRSLTSKAPDLKAK